MARKSVHFNAVQFQSLSEATTLAMPHDFFFRQLGLIGRKLVTKNMTFSSFFLVLYVNLENVTQI